jgi:TonB family protein
VGTNSILLARIDYEKPTVTDEDRIAIRQILDDVGDAVEAKVPRTGAAQPPSNAFFIDPQVLSSNPQGVDLGPYLNAVNNRIRANWFAVMPETARNGQQGRVDVLFAIARDGSIQDLRLVATSRNDALDQAATIAIQTSNPLPPLPAEFKGDRMALRYAFLYNLTPAR